MKKNSSCRLDFLSPLSEVPGFGPLRVAALQESGLQTIEDLLYHFPLRYLDRSVIVPLGELPRHRTKTCTCIGTITQSRVEPGRRTRLRIQVTDETGSCEALWFHGVPFFRKTLTKGKKILLHGMVQQSHTVQMIHPFTEIMSEKTALPEVPFLPQYPLTVVMRERGVMQKTIFSAIRWIIKNVKHYPKILPGIIEAKKGFPPLAECLEKIHVPPALENLDFYYRRLRYEELYELCLTLRFSKRTFALPGRRLCAGNLPDTLKKQLPFTLTGEQEKAIGILYSDSASGQRMHRLLQGDVGCGKTVVAAFACLPALNNGLQVAWLAPTEILAMQTSNQLAAWFKPLNISLALLTGSMATSDKKAVAADLRSGAISFVVGTHALIQEAIAFSGLGIVIIDELHKFGSKQRLTLQQKDPLCDFLLMSATPIPQTLAKTLYGDLDIVTIKSLPAKRKPVSTHLVPPEKRSDMEIFIRKELIENNSQAFYIVPRIDSAIEENQDSRDIGKVMEELSTGTLAEVSKAAIHGRLEAGEKERIMEEFASGALKLLIATTIVEVGIDVPNATIMVIEHADFFGLSQLHQLRGRVGRGDKKSYTFLLSNATGNEDSQKRLKKFCALHDGFEIAELDLTLRGPGDVDGFKQSGFGELQIADIIRDAGMFMEIQEELSTLLMSQSI